METLADQLAIGTTCLRAPLLDNVIQVGTSRSLPAATIAVHRTPDAVEVYRTDGVPLKAQIVSVGSDGSTARSDVFTAPLDVLRLRRIRRDGSRQWVVVNAPAQRSDAVRQLVETITSFAVGKQNGRVRPPQAGRPAS